mmetsp:Transcript_33425/g.83434  ORF Transcript_33425/g.83434 Transcript_33425/m.83434 type:complete len:232 (-) Transcript_33425:726-1421(-)
MYDDHKPRPSYHRYKTPFSSDGDTTHAKHGSPAPGPQPPAWWPTCQRTYESRLETRDSSSMPLRAARLAKRSTRSPLRAAPRRATSRRAADPSPTSASPRPSSRAHGPPVGSQRLACGAPHPHAARAAPSAGTRLARRARCAVPWASRGCAAASASTRSLSCMAGSGTRRPPRCRQTPRRPRCSRTLLPTHLPCAPTRPSASTTRRRRRWRRPHSRGRRDPAYCPLVVARR